MSAFIRLQDGDATDVERLLLEAGAEDVPSPGARARTLVAVGAAAGAALATPGTVHAAATAVAGTGSAKTAGTMTALMLGKWLGTGALLGAVTAACIATATTPGLLGTDRAEPSVNGAGAAVAATPRAVVRPATPLAVPNRDVGAAKTPVERAPEGRAVNIAAVAVNGRGLLASDGVPVGSEPTVAMPRGGVAPSGSGSRVLAEVASLDRARSALASGDAGAALERLTDHERQFAGGALEPEAVVLEVRALVQLGRRADAAARVNRFLAAHPDSSQGARLRALVGAAPR